MEHILYFKSEHLQTCWDRSKAPLRQTSMLGARQGAEWKIAFDKIHAAIGTGFLFLLCGIRGSGKTQMGIEIMSEKITKSVDLTLASPNYLIAPTFPALYVPAIDFFMDVKATYRKASIKDAKAVIADYLKPEVLVVDEITVRGETKWEDDLFFSMVDRRYSAMKDTILIANLKPAEVAASVGASIASRMQECGGIINCDWESFRSKP